MGAGTGGYSKSRVGAMGVNLAVRGGATLEVQLIGRLESPSLRLEARRIVVAGPLHFAGGALIGSTLADQAMMSLSSAAESSSRASQAGLQAETKTH